MNDIVAILLLANVMALNIGVAMLYMSSRKRWLKFGKQCHAAAMGLDNDSSFRSARIAVLTTASEALKVA